MDVLLFFFKSKRNDGACLVVFASEGERVYVDEVSEITARSEVDVIA